MNIKKRIKSKKVLILLILIIFGLVLASSVLVILYSRDSDIQLKINGESVSKEEFVQTMKEKQYDVTVYFKQNYDAQVDKKFWETSFEGEVPYKKLADETLEELKYRHAIFDIAEEKGYIDDADYVSLKRQMEEENQEREEKKERGEAVYGLSEYTMDLYLEYEISSIKEQYCNDEGNEDMEISTEELQDYYNSREWLVGEDGKKAEFEEIRSVLEKDIREKRYEEMVEKAAGDSSVDVKKDSLYTFTLKNIKK